MPLDPVSTLSTSRETQGEFHLSASAFERLSALVNAECGILLSRNKSNLIVSRLGKRLTALRLPDFHAYCDYVEGEGRQQERRMMTSLLTTNVTRFFREPHHFEALRNDVLPDLIARARAGARVRLWSAGCSTGEEPLSIAMEVLDLCPDAAKLDLRILGTDIDPASVELARRAEYDATAVQNVPPRQRDPYFDAVPDSTRFKASQKLRSLVTFAELNLVQNWPMEGAFDVIFCRNVVIYFDADTQAALWPRFADALAPGGHMFIGHSERLSGPGQDRFIPNGITQYRRI